MNRGDTVRVWPHGDESSSAIGEVILISKNGASIAVGFKDKPPFVRLAEGFAVHPQYGIVMLASRECISNGQLVGPWVELSGGHYEIERVRQ